MKRVVFISHSSADRPIAERLCTYLEQNGVGCWIAPRDVTPGKNYGAAIVDAIDECRIFVLILSSHSNKSRQVVREVERAASTDSVILPFRIEDVQPSRDIAFYVSAAHWLDAANYQVDEQFDELLAAIQDWQKAAPEQTSAAISGGASSPPPLPTAIAAASAAAAPSAIPRSARTRLFPLLAGLFVVLVAAAGLFLFRYSHRQGDSRDEARPIDTPSSTLTNATATPVEPSPTEPETTPTEAPTPSAVASPAITPIRLKPGERRRPTASPQSVGETSASPGTTEQSPAAVSVNSGESTARAKPIVREVAASSQTNNEFRPNYAFDGNPATGWMPKGDGTDHALFVHFKSPATVRTVSILNGDGRDEEHYKASGRVKTLRIVLSDGTNQLLTFKDEMKMQRFELTTPVTAAWVKFEIVSVFPGKAKHAEISEIAFNEDQP
ncbi:MAG: NADase-type glycan-binding domain-containing protein [Chthoniobacterales bacterium]